MWINKEEEKEQFSPVSVLDCPYEDEDEDDESSSSSPFRCRIARMEGPFVFCFLFLVFSQFFIYFFYAWKV